MSQRFLLSAKARTLSLRSVLRVTDDEAESVFRCKARRTDFSITSGALFAFHKMPLRNYSAAMTIFYNEVKCKSSFDDFSLLIRSEQNCFHAGAQNSRRDGQ